MRTDILTYKGYYTHIKYDSSTHDLYGVIEGIDDYIDFSSGDGKEIEEEFKKAVDDYIEFCLSNGKEPEKAYSGCFNVRIPGDVHRSLAKEAAANSKNLNQLVSEILASHFAVRS